MLMRGLHSYAVQSEVGGALLSLRKQGATRLPDGGAALAFHPQLPSTLLSGPRLGEQRFAAISHTRRRHATRAISMMSGGKYALVDSGNYSIRAARRLERFDGVLVDRPCPAAEWRPGVLSCRARAMRCAALRQRMGLQAARRVCGVQRRSSTN
eukprot:819070-Rhodomonas_salina.2